MTTPNQETSKVTVTSITPAERQADQQQRTRKEKTLDLIKAYARSPEVVSRFTNLLGGTGPGKRYVESVLIAVTDNEDLLNCSPKSIMVAAMRAASLQLSVDPALRQAHLVPYRNEVNFIPDYHGLLQLTTATGMYIHPPHVSEVWEGEEVEEDRFTGRVTVNGKRTGDTITGWIAYYKDIHGNERFLYMSNDDCDKHGKKYNPGGFASKKSAWATDRDKMRRKTCLRVFLTQWGYFSPRIKNVIFMDDEDNGEVIDLDPMDELPEVDEVTLQEKEVRAPNESMSQLGFNPDPVRDTTWNEWQNLVLRAKAVNVPYTEIKREDMTEVDLLASIDELKEFVVGAEEQASSGG